MIEKVCWECNGKGHTMTNAQIADIKRQFGKKNRKQAFKKIENLQKRRFKCKHCEGKGILYYPEASDLKLARTPMGEIIARKRRNLIR